MDIDAHDNTIKPATQHPDLADALDACKDVLDMHVALCHPHVRSVHHAFKMALKKMFPDVDERNLNKWLPDPTVPETGTWLDRPRRTNG